MAEDTRRTGLGLTLAAILGAACISPRSEVPDAALPPGGAGGSMSGRVPESQGPAAADPAARAPEAGANPPGAGAPARDGAAVVPDAAAMSGMAGQCVPDSRRCRPNDPFLLEVCSSSGQWVPTAPCPYLCNAGACTGSCRPGERRCQASGMAVETCQADASRWTFMETCELGCDAATAMCKSCAPPARACQGGCSLPTDPKACGPDCLVCSIPVGGTAACDGISCDVTCGSGYMRCFEDEPGRRSCAATLRGFESGTNEGFRLFDATNGETHFESFASTANAHSGTRSFAVPLGRFPIIDWVAILCADPNFRPGYDLRGKTLSFWYFLDRATLPSGSLFIPRVGSVYEPSSLVRNVRQWVQVSVTLDSSADNNNDFVAIRFDAGSDPTGTLYLDDLQVQ